MASRKPTPPGTKGAGPVAENRGKFKATATDVAERERLYSTASEAELQADARQTIPRIKVRRADDLFVAELTLYNMKVVPGNAPSISRLDTSRDSILVVELQPQSFGEEAFQVATLVEPADPIPPLGGTRIRISGPSRLAFTMPDGVVSLPYTLDAVLNACRTWPLRKMFTAVPDLIGMGLPLEDNNADLLGSIVDSNDFTATLRGIKSAVGDLGTPAAAAAVTAAGKRIADKASAALRSTDPARASAVLDANVRTELSALATQFKSLADSKSQALATVALRYEAISALAKLGLTKVGDAAVNPLLPLLAGPFRPGVKATALELPYRLITSPINAARFTHRTTAPLHQGRCELWHTRLTNASGNTGVDTPTRLRAIWSDDYVYDNFSDKINAPFRMPLDAQDRKMLVQLTAGWDEHVDDDSEPDGERPYTPRAIRSDRVILSALGGMLDANGSWDPRPHGVDLAQWRHLMSLGRDHYVRVVYAGFLLPFGHAASFIKVTERKFEGTDSGNSLTKRVAALRQRFFLVVREPLKTFDGSYHITGGHPFPFTSVELLTRITPNLLDPSTDACRVAENGHTLYQADGVTGGVTPRQLFWPMIGQAAADGDFRFDIAATDRDGRRISFNMPLLFMSEVANTGSVKTSDDAVGIALISNIIKAYNEASDIRRQVQLGGASVCYAPPDPGGAGDPRMPTDTLKFRAGGVKGQRSATRINTYPEVEEARVTLLAAQRILGRSINAVDVKYRDFYRQNGFTGGNDGEVFLEIKGSGFDMSFGPDAANSRSDVVGAVASPSMQVKGISRRVGLASDIEQIATNNFDPKDFFGNARILGGIKLSDVVPKVTGLTGPGAPKFVTRELPASGTLPARTEARWDWQTNLSKHDPRKLLLPSADGNTPSAFRMLAVTTTSIGDPKSATTVATATIGNFKINLFEFIVLWFRELEFTTQQGQKPDVHVDLHPTRGVEFGGPLEFVNQLKNLLPGNGFSDPSALSVTPSGIEAKYSLSVPSVQVGIFAISGLSIGARFALPFDTQPVEVGFNFGERENPFSLTVSLLGGGGFLSIGIGADGVREIEAALEAGARLAIDLGVASGSVEIKAGIYFHWLSSDDPTGGLVELAGYVRVHGELDVMGIICISITFNLQLAYTKEGKRSVIWGEASVTVEIEVLVFSGEVTVRCRREFGGSEADPTFAQLITGDDTWMTYCSAFAEN